MSFATALGAISEEAIYTMGLYARLYSTCGRQLAVDVVQANFVGSDPISGRKLRGVQLLFEISSFTDIWSANANIEDVANCNSSGVKMEERRLETTDQESFIS